MKYFAYGVNTNLASMARRCPDAFPLGTARLPRHRLRFSLHADVVHDRNCEVLGLLWEISAADLAALDYFEGYPFRYGRRHVQLVHEGNAVRAWMYFLQPGEADCLPDRNYVDAVVEGYRQNAIPLHQLLTAIARIEQRLAS